MIKNPESYLNGYLAIMNPDEGFTLYGQIRKISFGMDSIFIIEFHWLAEMKHYSAATWVITPVDQKMFSTEFFHVMPPDSPGTSKLWSPFTGVMMEFSNMPTTNGPSLEFYKELIATA
ncbi:hypothetical protein A2392_00520 [Candidatus Kaiserbacteria bacterium RIFOXYB1_FULL_46_14]|uniref:Uncharacterized protein n=1 Tax=Candidatus Kaiserbacteria bacterium RIFOXYB1_FULL_46_14 TaxID=1798531 RepID=A0A1F6FJ39_9BACT|nr:MAG: hypothetical protein A2392_00520 [Candidatus Kaiserbacteria bacterium RIFOXYB1_FULL_46_14]